MLVAVFFCCLAAFLFLRERKLSRRLHELSERLKALERTRSGESVAPEAQATPQTPDAPPLADDLLRRTPPPLPPEPSLAPLPSESAPAQSFHSSTPAPHLPTPSTPPPIPTFPSPPATPPPTPPETEKEPASLELELGTFWLVRVGVVLLLTALALFGNYAYHNLIGNLGPAGKVALLYTASAALLVLGGRLQKNTNSASLSNYGGVLFAGGLAAVYFTTYCAHHLPALRIIESALLDGILLLGCAAIILWRADRQKSQTLAFLSFGLAFYTSLITGVGAFTLVSNLVLSVATLWILWRHGWSPLCFAALLMSYAGFGFFRFRVAAGSSLAFDAGFLVLYWSLFTTSTFLLRGGACALHRLEWFTTLNNGALLLFGAELFQRESPSNLWLLLLGYGFALLGLSRLTKHILPTQSSLANSHLHHGILVATLALPVRLSDLQWPLLLGAESVLLCILATKSSNRILKFWSLLTGLLACLYFPSTLEREFGPRCWNGAFLGALMVMNAWLAHRSKDAQSPRLLRKTSVAFVLLALGVWLTTTQHFASTQAFQILLAFEALTLALIAAALGFRELFLLSQGLLLFAQFSRLLQFMCAAPVFWQPLSLIGASIALALCNQHQARRLFSFSAENPPPHRELALALPLWLIRIHLWMAFVLSVQWIFSDAASAHQTWLLTTCAALVFAAGLWHANRPLLFAALAYAATALAALWLRDGSESVHWPDGAAMAAIFCAQQVLRKNPRNLSASTGVHAAMVFGAGSGLWRVCSAWTESYSADLSPALAWSGLALCAMGAGILLRERLYRWLGLGLLGAALLRLSLVDVWSQDTLHRMLTFLSLGVALLLAGFFYNKYRDAIRKWL